MVSIDQIDQGASESDICMLYNLKKRSETATDAQNLNNVTEAGRQQN